MRVLLLTIAVTLGFTSTASAGRITQPMFAAADQYGTEYAQYQGWEYTDRLSTAHGDYRHAYVTLVFATNYHGTDNGRAVLVPWTWKVQARVTRCGPGWYVVSTPDSVSGCSVWRPRW